MIKLAVISFGMLLVASQLAASASVPSNERDVEKIRLLIEAQTHKAFIILEKAGQPAGGESKVHRLAVAINQNAPQRWNKMGEMEFYNIYEQNFATPCVVIKALRELYGSDNLQAALGQDDSWTARTIGRINEYADICSEMQQVNAGELLTELRQIRNRLEEFAQMTKKY